MEPDIDDDTVLRPRPDGGSPVTDAGLVDGDTIIRARAPFADVPIEAFRELASQETPAPLVVRPQPHEPHALIEPPSTSVPSSPTHSRFYRFRLNTGEPIPLDLPALLGRNPIAPRIAVGAAPRLIRVSSPKHEVSGTHLELRQHGTSVVVTDLKSTNGTVVTIPGAIPLKLRQGESVVVSTGTVVDIGDGNIVEILPIRLSSSQHL